jgi:hypothetical protein
MYQWIKQRVCELQKDLCSHGHDMRDYQRVGYAEDT